MSEQATDKNCLHYDLIAADFIRERPQGARERKYLDLLVSSAPENGHVLDCGCGFGKPIASYLIDKGLTVTGLDGSQKLLDQFRKNFPAMAAIYGDMTSVALDETYDAVIAWDSFFHLSQEAQRAMFARFAAWIKPGGRLLFTSGPEEGTAAGDMFGHHFTYGCLSPEEYRSLLHRNGFEVLLSEFDEPNSKIHMTWIAQARS